MKKTGLLLLAAGLLFSNNAFALSVTTTGNANTLAENILGTGISLVGSATYTGAAGASGTFVNGGNIGISNGIILTSGSAVGAVGPNSSSSYTVNNGTSGSALLSSLVGGQTTNDAARLSFDFTSLGGNLFFNYVFASEEYNEYAGSSYNDVFAFFLDGQNIALLPGTSTPVTINNVNLGANQTYYRNNVSGSYDTQYDGLTTVLTASALGLTAGTHHIDIAIADVMDSSYDSGVFIQGGSFSDINPAAPVPEPGTVVLLGAGLAGLGFFRRRTKK